MGVTGCRLEMLFLAPEERGRGLGRRLVQYGVRQYGLREVTVNEQNPQAVGFYEHLGFTVYQRTARDEVRNLLSHQAKLDGQYAVTPSDAVQRLLEEVLCKVEEPQRVCDVMTPVDRMLTATPQTGVLEVMRKMRQQGLSHVPLLENGRVSGIFSVETIFQAVTDNACRVGEDTVLAAFARYLPLDRHMGHDFRFVGRGVLTAEAEAIFDRAGSRNHKLKLLLVTRSGAAAEPLLGVVSPYDLLGQPD